MASDVATNGWVGDTQGSTTNLAKSTVIPVNSLPASNYAVGQLVLLTTNGTIHRNDGSYATPSWTPLTFAQFALSTAVQRVEFADTTTSTTYVDISGATVTLGSGGKFIATAVIITKLTAVGNRLNFRWVDNATAKNAVGIDAAVANYAHCVVLMLTGTCSGQAIKLQWKVQSGTGTVYGGGDEYSHIEVIEIR
jgi:hypothetical protein